MFANIGQAAPFSPFPVAVAPAVVIRKAFASGVAAARAAVARAVMPSYADKHARDVDIVSVSRWNGHGRNSVMWSDIGYRI